MKKLYILALSLFVAAGSFAQNYLTYDCNALRAGDIRNLKQIDYQEQGEGGTKKIWDYSQAKEIKDMVLSQAENRSITSNRNLNLICDEGGVKNTYFEISNSQKMYWGLENENVKIQFNEPIVDLKFPFLYLESVSGIMDGTYTDLKRNETNSIKGTYTTQADAWGTLALPDGNVYEGVLRIKVEKNYTQTFKNGDQDAEYQVRTVRYQYFAKGVRYPVLIVLESDVKTDCNCACGYKTKEAYYETPAIQFNEDKENNIELSIGNFEYSVTPNPFESDLHISFVLENEAKIDMDIIDMNGKIVKKIVNKNLEEGKYTYDVNTTDVIEGNYVLRLRVNKELYITKLIKK